MDLLEKVFEDKRATGPTKILKVPYYTVFHQFHTAVRGPTTLYSICIASNTSVVLKFSCLKVAQVSSTESRLPCLLHAPLRRTMPLMLAVACANVYGGSIAMAHGDAVLQPYQFDPESDPEGESPEEIQTLWLQQDIAE